MYLGKKSVDDLAWVDKVTEGLYSSAFMEKAEAAIKKMSQRGAGEYSAKQIVDAIGFIFDQRVH